LMLCLPISLSVYFAFFDTSALVPSSLYAFVGTFLISLLLAFFLRWIGKKGSGFLYRREGLILVVLIWFVTPALAGLPFLLSGTLKNPFQAYFEAASGITTTGATTMHPKRYDEVTGNEIPIERTFCGAHTIAYSFWGTIAPIKDSKTGKVLLEGIEAVSFELLFWRSFIQWLGGVGIVVLFVAVLPVLGVGGRILYQAEVPGPLKDSLTPRIKETAYFLWKIYVGMSLLEIILLMAFNSDIGLFEACTITFSTVSTGGFNIRNASIGALGSSATDWTVIFFMLFGSINFSLYFFVLRGKIYKLYNTELFVYLCLLAISCGLVAFSIVGTTKVLITGEVDGIFSLGDAIRFATFQVVSAQTTTGFVTADYDIWPYAAQVIMLIIMFIGGMAGSTAGGIKVMRYFMAFRIVQHKLESIFRPETVRRFRVSDRDVDTGTEILVLSYFSIVILIVVLAFLLYVFDGVDPESSISLVALMINNIGIGFRMAAPNESCAFLSNFGLCLSSILMILGRLEFLAILAILFPSFWKTKT